MDFAIIRLQGHQEVVNAKTQNLVVDRITEKDGSFIKPEVLLTSVSGEVQVGMPVITDFPIELEIVKEEKGEKIYVQKFHSKARYRRRTGFRAKQTVLKVVKFGEEVKKTIKKAIKPIKTAKKIVAKK